MGAQVGRCAALVDAGHPLQPVEERSHRAGIETRPIQYLQTHAIRLALVVAREVELALDRSRLPERERRLGRLRTRARGEYRHRHRGKRCDLALLLLHHHARDMPLRDVRDLVRQHARHL